MKIIPKKLFKAGHKIFYAKRYVCTDSGWQMTSMFISGMQHILKCEKIT